MKEKKVLIIFETSIIRNPDAPFGFINFGSAYLDIKKYIRDNDLVDRVKIGVTQMTINELLHGRVEEYEKELKNAEEVTKKFKELPNLDFSIKKDGFDFRKYFTNLLRVYLKRERIIVLKHPKSKTLFQIIARSLLKKAPFTQSNKHSDFGFKDVVIWESILNFNGIVHFDKVIFFTNDSDFSDICKKEFLEKYDCTFLALKDQELIKKELDITKAFHRAIETSSNDTEEEIEKGFSLALKLEEDLELKKLLESDYFFEGMRQFLIESSNEKPTAEDIEIIEPVLDVDKDVMDDEVVGKLITTGVKIKGKKVIVQTHLDESNGIENYNLYEPTDNKS